MSTRDVLARAGASGERARAACERLTAASSDVAVAVRRAMPFLARRRTRVSVDPASATAFSAFSSEAHVVHTTRFAAGPDRATGVVGFDSGALAVIVDGVLGAATQTPARDRRPSGGRGSGGQLALASRVSASLVRALADALASRIGLTVEPAGDGAPEPLGTAAVLTVTVAEGARVFVAVPVSSLRREEETAGRGVDAALAAAMVDVEVDVIAELGTVRMALETLASLRVGDVVKLTLPLDERARVCAGGATLFRGRPTASGDVIGVAIEAREARHAA